MATSSFRKIRASSCLSFAPRFTRHTLQSRVVSLRPASTTRTIATAPKRLPWAGADQYRVQRSECWGRNGYATAAEALTKERRTGLYDFHVSHGGKMVPFGGWTMPLHYEGGGGQVAEHKHVREKAGLFDVGHMVQISIKGPSSTEFIANLTPSSISALQHSSPDGPFSSTLSVLLNENGGIIDDCMVTRQGDDQFYVVTNAARRDADLPWLEARRKEWNQKESGRSVEIEVLEDWGLVALQGPDSASILQPLLSGPQSDLSKVTFGKSTFINVDGVRCHVARGGYTGEDGFEISIPPSDTVRLTEKILSNPSVKLAGLAARDSLRLEAGLCLYGHDLDEKTSPVEGALSWLIGKDRREPGAFIGSETVLRHLKEGPPRRRVGFIVEGAPAREGAKIFDKDGNEEIGVVTSGIPSPTVGKNIAMGYVKNGHHKRGTDVQIEVRKKKRHAKVEKMPFAETRYYRG